MHAGQEVDLVLLTRGEAAVAEPVESGIACQTDVQLHVHRIVGRPLPGDANRWETIARAQRSCVRRTRALADVPGR